jgi:malonyl-CoA/methylmalonyl-CoA synthetase
LPFPGVSVKLFDDQHRPVEPGQVGEVYVAGPNVSPGYWNNPQATAAAFITFQNRAGRIETWFKTGDLAERSTDGYYTLRGRRSDLIISGGFNIYPREIEELLLDQPGIREAAVCGVNDPKRGEVPVAYVVSDDSFNPDLLEAVCRRSLASFKLPRAFIRVRELPRTALGKVQKHLLPLLDLNRDG